MRIINIIMFLLLINLKSYAQQNIFRLSENKKISFYDKNMIHIINTELRKYPRERGDSAFIQIEDSDGTFMDAFITLKKKNGIQNFIYLFLFSRNDKYYRVNLLSSKIPRINIKSIYNKLIDTNFIKEDTTYILSHKNTCHFYEGMGKLNKEISVWNTIFWKDETKLFAYRKLVAELFTYFSTGDFKNGIKPIALKDFRLIKYNPK